MRVKMRQIMGTNEFRTKKKKSPAVNFSLAGICFMFYVVSLKILLLVIVAFKICSGNHL